MTNEELEAGLIRIVNVVERLADSTQQNIETLTRKDEQLTDAQLHFQSQLGDLARIFQARIEAQDRAIEAQDRAIEAQDRAIEAQNRGIEVQNRAIEAQNRAIEAQNRAIEAQNRAIEAKDRAMEEHRMEMEALKQRQAESDQRFEVLLAELRYLIRQQPPQEGSESKG